MVIYGNQKILILNIPNVKICFQKKKSSSTLHNKNQSIRHLGILEENLYCVFSRIGDKPERIFYTKFRLTKNHSDWKFQK